MIKSYKNLASSKKKTTSFGRFDKKKNYSSFWMGEDDWYSRSTDRFAGLGAGAGEKSYTSDLVKAIKLNNYQRAIANFVNILTKKSIPVAFAGDTSYTDGQSVVISTDIKDANFDVSVGLALHEASHIVLTDFEYLKNMLGNTVHKMDCGQVGLSGWKSLLNWIEDRRIDNFIFKNSPGYRAYYHKMYDYYWNDKSITKGLQSADYRDPLEVDNYMFRITNSLNPASDPDALPGLREILNLIDVKNIARLQSTAESGTLALQVVQIINGYLQEAQEEAAQKDSSSAPDEVDSSSGLTNGEAGDKDQDNSTGTSGNNDIPNGANGNQSDKEELESLSDTEKKLIKNALQKQKDFLNGDTDKKEASRGLARKLKLAKDSGVDMQMTGTGDYEQACLVYDLTNDNRIARIVEITKQLTVLKEIRSKYNAEGGKAVEVAAVTEKIRELDKQFLKIVDDTFPRGYFQQCITKDHQEIITDGLNMGALLGKKLELRNETRQLEYNRLRNGHIDNRRLAQAGFGMETVFKRSVVSAYKKANLHISLDGSGSMRGTRWDNTAKMCMAICKAATYVQNLDVQVSIRVTGDNHTPAAMVVYDSRKNPLKQLIDTLLMFEPGGFTPEGLCFEAMKLKGLFIPGTKEQDSFLLNLSDGEPSGCKGYDGDKAWQHTKNIVRELETKLGMGIIGFFMHSHTDKAPGWALTNSASGRIFTGMYGAKNSFDVSAEDALSIARAMNKKFLEMT